MAILQEFRTLFTNRSYEVNYAVKEAYDCVMVFSVLGLLCAWERQKIRLEKQQKMRTKRL